MTGTCTTCGKPADPHPYRHPITRMGGNDSEIPNSPKIPDGGRLTDEQVRSVGQGVLSHTWLQPMAAELLALRARVTELEAEAQAEACAIDEARGDLNDALDRAAAAETARAALIESWEAEANQHRLTGHFGIAEGLRIAIDELREVADRG